MGRVQPAAVQPPGLRLPVSRGAQSVAVPARACKLGKPGRGNPGPQFSPLRAAFCREAFRGPAPSPQENWALRRTGRSGELGVRTLQRRNLDLHRGARETGPDHHGLRSRRGERSAHSGPAPFEERAIGQYVVHPYDLVEVRSGLFNGVRDVHTTLRDLLGDVLRDRHRQVVVPVVPETDTQAPTTTARE